MQPAAPLKLWWCWNHEQMNRIQRIPCPIVEWIMNMPVYLTRCTLAFETLWALVGVIIWNKNWRCFPVVQIKFYMIYRFMANYCHSFSLLVRLLKWRWTWLQWKKTLLSCGTSATQEYIDGDAHFMNYAIQIDGLTAALPLLFFFLFLLRGASVTKLIKMQLCTLTQVNCIRIAYLSSHAYESLHTRSFEPFRSFFIFFLPLLMHCSDFIILTIGCIAIAAGGWVCSFIFHRSSTAFNTPRTAFKCSLYQLIEQQIEHGGKLQIVVD